jgi:hypothetical protein
MTVSGRIWTSRHSSPEPLQPANDILEGVFGGKNIRDMVHCQRSQTSEQAEADDNTEEPRSTASGCPEQVLILLARSRDQFTGW